MLNPDGGGFVGAAVGEILFSFGGINGRSSVLSRPLSPTIEPSLMSNQVKPVAQKTMALTINLKPGWSSQQVSEAYEKAHLITTEGVNLKLNRANTENRPPNLKQNFLKQGGVVKSGQDVDHTQDLILNGNPGVDGKTNLSGRDRSVNRIFGKQFEIQTKNVPDNTRVSGVYINPFGKLKK
jgi:bifunctional N-acetylglucosamine-1-phosphate-uridyltransferase/glucosamine-1-phosphate-acetyltransferase GlmU-like protein